MHELFGFGTIELYITQATVYSLLAYMDSDFTFCKKKTKESVI